eukprot:1803436-Amphidinium_carterae.1
MNTERSRHFGTGSAPSGCDFSVVCTAQARANAPIWNARKDARCTPAYVYVKSSTVAKASRVLMVAFPMFTRQSKLPE